MIQKLWKFIADLKLTFWLLLAVIALLITGALYSKADYHLFERINYMPVTEWFRTLGMPVLIKSWWVPAIFGVMALLAANTFACAIERLRSLWPRRRDMAASRFLVLLAPSIIHLLFVTIMGGHLLTFEWIEYRRYAVDPGSAIELPDGNRVVVRDIRTENYPADTYLKDRLKNARYTLEISGTGGTLERPLAFLEPLRIGSAFLHADVSKRAPGVMAEKGATVCNRAEVKSLPSSGPQFYIVYSRDPVLPVIVMLLLVISGVMTWYYVMTTGRAKEA
ncbi:MAG: hypothetical protein KBA61_16745 [Spirochaetes bacterium]|nr:hypothetical protein [Spirochaetota bacterium]